MTGQNSATMIDADRKQLERALRKCIDRSPVRTAEYYHRGYITRVRHEDGAYLVTTDKGYTDIRYPVKRAATLAQAAYCCECNEYQGGDPTGWVPAR